MNLIQDMTKTINQLIYKYQIRCMKARTFLKTAKQEYELQYIHFIKQFQKQGNKIRPQKFIQFCMGASQPILRKKQFLIDFQKIAINYFPILMNNKHLLRNNSLISVLQFYKCLNIHRCDLFNLLEEVFQSQLPKMSLDQLIRIYKIFVELNHCNNPSMREDLQKISILKFRQTQHQKVNSLILHDSLLVLSYDPLIHQYQMEQVLRMMQKKICEMEQDQIEEMKQCKTMRCVNSALRLHELELSSTRYKEVLHQSEKRARDIKKQIAFLKKSQFTGGSGGTHIYQSVFENIFFNKLEKMGYNSQRNRFIGPFEYDIIISGTKKHRHFPFKNTQEIISKADLTQFQSMVNFTWVEKFNRFTDKIVLNLNGPCHFINSDLYGNKQITRSEVMKNKFLKLHGYNKYNFVNSQQWQQLNEDTNSIDQFITKLIEQPLSVHQIL